MDEQVYIVFDGTSYFGVYACDIAEYINNEDYEVDGPYPEWNEEIDWKIEDLNNDAYKNERYY